MNGNPPLMYISVPDDCQEAVPLVDLGCPHFARQVKRILKKIEKGQSVVEKPLCRLSSDGQLEPTDFVLHAEPNESSHGFVVTKFSDGNSEQNLYKLPVTRFSVKRQTDLQSPAEKKPMPGNLESTLQEFSEKLNHIDISLSTALSTIKKTTQKRKSAKIVPAPPKPVSKVETAEPPSTPIVRTEKPKPKQYPNPNYQIKNPEFVQSLDRTIDRVLHRLCANKSVKALTNLEQHIEIELLDLTSSVEYTPVKVQSPVKKKIKHHERDHSISVDMDET